MLTRAIEKIFKRDLSEAEKEIERANGLAPNYFEVHRVKAFLSISQEDFFAAEAAYETAMSLAPNRAPLRLWFAGFISRQLGDQQRAIEQLRGEAGAVEFARPMADCLAVGADGANVERLDAAGPQQCLHHVGIGASNGIGGQLSALQLVVARRVQRQQLATQRRWKGPES